MRCLARAVPLLSLLASCSFTLHVQSTWDHCAWAGTQPRSASRELTVDCAPEMAVVGTELNCAARAGSLTVALVDPTGVERQHQVVQSGEQQVRLSWPACAGTWRLQVTAEDFVGSYEVELAATSRPIPVRVELVSGPDR